MVLRIPSLFFARRSVIVPGVAMPVLDTNTLRQAALRASWVRDQRVARRRLAMRWALWWIWKYRARLSAAFAAVIALVVLLYLLGVIGPWTRSAMPAQDTGLTLRLDTQLQERSAQPAAPRPPPLDAPSPIQLKPATQLKN